MKKLLFLLLFIPLVSFGQTAEEYFQSGINNYKNGDYHEAIADYTKLIELLKSAGHMDARSNSIARAKSYYNRAQAKFSLKDYKGARDDFKSVIMVILWDPLEEPNPFKDGVLLFDSYFGVALCGNYIEEYNEAIQYLSLAIDIRPNSFSSYYNRGIAKDRLGDYSGAIADYTKAIPHSNSPETKSSAYYNRARAKNAFKDYSGAIADYTKAIEINPNDANAYYSRGVASINLKDYSRAIADYTKAIEINPNDAVAYYSRGKSKQLLKDYSGAIADYNMTIKIQPTRAEVYYIRAIAKESSGIDACADAKKAKELQYHDRYPFLEYKNIDELIERVCKSIY